MSETYKWANTIFRTPSQANYACVGDFIWACGKNRADQVARLDAQKCLEELLENWPLPYPEVWDETDILMAIKEEIAYARMLIEEE